MISVHLCAEGGMYKNIGGLNLFSLRGGEREKGQQGREKGQESFLEGKASKICFFERMCIFEGGGAGG